MQKRLNVRKIYFNVMKGEQMKSLKSKKGITLIALVITIIVLLILAGVSINAVIGENGIATKAKLSKQEMVIAEDKEKINLAIAEYEMESIEDDSKSLEEFLKSQDWCEDAVFDDDSKMVAVTMVNGSKYEIEVSGNVNGKDEFDWDVILEEANSNPEKYKHSEQLVSNYIAIGTDGQSVNMDLWNPTLLDDGTWILGVLNRYEVNTSYAGTFDDGKIEGKIPQYIYNVETTKFEPLTKMHGTFRNKTELKYCPEIPETVYDLYATFYNTGITECYLHDGITSLGYATFKECKSLKSITLPSEIKTIESEVFSGCVSLTSFIIPEGIEKIKFGAFSRCEELKNIVIPSSVVEIQAQAFAGCTDLATVYFEQTTVPTFGDSVFYKISGGMTTFYFKNSTVANAFTTSYYNSSYGTKSTDYNW